MGAISFKELRYLDVSDNRKVNSSFLLRLGMTDPLVKVFQVFCYCVHFQVTLAGIKLAMTQCPSLEILIKPKPNAKFTSADGQKICSRLKYLLQ